MLIYVLVHCGTVSVEIEADYMWGLLHPSLLTGEGGYYLTSLSSAVLVLKKFKEMQETKASQQEVIQYKRLATREKGHSYICVNYCLRSACTG